MIKTKILDFEIKRGSNELLPRYLIHDRDGKFTAHADQLLRMIGTKPLRLPVRSPNLSAHAERWVRMAREECLDRVIVLNEQHLRWGLSEFIRYYNQRRPHRSKGLRVLTGSTEDQYSRYQPSPTCGYSTRFRQSRPHVEAICESAWNRGRARLSRADFRCVGSAVTASFQRARPAMNPEQPFSQPICNWSLNISYGSPADNRAQGT